MRIFLKSIVFSGLLALALPAFAQLHLNINIGPPRPRREVVFRAPSAGLVWVPGYYVYDRSVEDYMWTPGRWEAPPSPREVWVAPRYVRNGNSYDYYEGRWGTSRRSRVVSAPSRSYSRDARSQNDNGDHHDNGKHNGWGKHNGNSDHGNSDQGNSAHGNRGR